MTRDVDNFSAIHQIAFNAVMKSDIMIRKELFGNIMLSGSSTLFPGFVERLKKELLTLAPSGTKIKIFDSKSRNIAAW